RAVGRLRGLGLGPADARSGRLPGRGEPRDPPRLPRPQARLAGRELPEGRGHHSPLAAGPHPGRIDTMKALEFSRNLPRYAAARLAGTFVAGRGAGPGPLSLVDIDPPELPGPDWVRVRPRLAGI